MEKNRVWISIHVWSFPWKFLRTLCLKLNSILSTEALSAICYSAGWRGQEAAKLRDQCSESHKWSFDHCFHLFYLYKMRWFAFLWIRGQCQSLWPCSKVRKANKEIFKKYTYIFRAVLGSQKSREVIEISHIPLAPHMYSFPHYQLPNRIDSYHVCIRASALG